MKVKHTFFSLKICLFKIEGTTSCELVQGGRGRGRRKESSPSRLPTERGAPGRAQSHKPEIRT